MAKKKRQRLPALGTSVARPRLGHQYIADTVKNPKSRVPDQIVSVCSYSLSGHNLGWASWDIRVRTRAQLASALEKLARKVRSTRDWRKP